MRLILYRVSLSNYVCRHLQLEGTIWLHVSRKLLSYHKWFWKPWSEIPPYVKKEFQHHSHAHSDASITSSTVAEPAHVTGYANSSRNICYDSYPSHPHSEYDNDGVTHSHTVTVTFASANLGSPNWYQHVHALGGTFASGGGPHTHSGQGTCSNNFCGQSGICTNLAHGHTHTDTFSLASGGNAHTDHTISGNSGYADSGQTPQSHTHTFSFTSGGTGESHTHAYSGSTSNSACYNGHVHQHNWSGTSEYATHTHTGSGTSGSGGENPSGQMLMRLVKMVGL